MSPHIADFVKIYFNFAGTTVTLQSSRQAGQDCIRYCAISDSNDHMCSREILLVGGCLCAETAPIWGCRGFRWLDASQLPVHASISQEMIQNVVTKFVQIIIKYSIYLSGSFLSDFQATATPTTQNHCHCLCTALQHDCHCTVTATANAATAIPATTHNCAALFGKRATSMILGYAGAPAAMAVHLCFVYGTLKMSFPNHQVSYSCMPSLINTPPSTHTSAFIHTCMPTTTTPVPQALQVAAPQLQHSHNNFCVGRYMQKGQEESSLEQRTTIKD